MQKVRIQLSYDGTDFCGWQKQSGSPKTPTVQGAVESALSRMFDTPVTVCGCSRTDTGVHALDQHIHFLAPKPIENYNVLHALNSLTPESISAHQAWICPEDFHAIASVEQKTYQYRIWQSPTPNALLSRYRFWRRHPLDLNYLQQASQFLLGKQDFSSFQSRGSEVSTTIREVFSAQWSQNDPHEILFQIQGSGFLKQMVRNIVGTLLDLHDSQQPADMVKEILEAKNRQKALGTASPQGLYLYQVKYSETLDKKCRKI